MSDILAGTVGANQNGTIKMLIQGIGHHYGIDGSTKVGDAVAKVQAAGIPLLSIIATLLPIILGLFSGQKLDLQAIINAILALLPKGN